METTPDKEPKIAVYEAPEGVLNVVIRTIDDEELDTLGRSDRREPKRAH